ncbi:MAG TPA: diacylglycerol kinase [Fimbriiglobus sp.]|jgi:diacylglycerol kinase|nr:diacylglycerol kinase [Fimbriiglobus sp.]
MTATWQTVETPDRVKQPRRWRDKFSEAFRGVRGGMQGQSSFCVHLFFACLAVLAAAVLQCDPFEWCLIIGCIGLVFTAELFNTAVETLFKGLDPSARDRVYHALDIAAGAVLVACLTAATVGTIVFGRKLLAILAT